MVFLTCLQLSPLSWAQSGPEYTPPFASKESAAAAPKLVVRTFSDRKTGKIELQPSIVAVNKRISIRDFDGAMKTGKDTRLPIYLNDKLLLEINLDAAFQAGGKWHSVFAAPPVVQSDPATQRVTFQFPWTTPQGRDTAFTYTLSVRVDGKIDLNWNVGCAGQEYDRLVAENRFNWSASLAFPKGYRSSSIIVDGKQLAYYPADQFPERRTTRTWKHGNEGMVEIKPAPTVNRSFSSIAINPQDDTEAVTLTFPGYKGSLFESAKFTPGEDTTYTMFVRMRSSDNSPTGSIQFDFHKTLLAGKDRPPAVEGHDLWKEDALHLPLSPTRNLFPNPSFEQGLRYWRWLNGGARFSFSEIRHYGVDDNGLFGQKALVINPQQAGVATLTSFCLPSQKGKTYTISFYAKAESPGASAQLSVHSRKDGGKFSRSVAFRDPMKPLTTDWKRYSQTMVSDGLPFALIVKTNNNGGRVWFDGIQFEAGDKATDFVCSPLEGKLFTSHPDNNPEYGQPINARFEIYGKPKTAGKAQFTLLNFFKEAVAEKTVTVKAGDTVALPFDEPKLGTGFYLLKVDYTVAGVDPYTDYYRFSVLKSLNGRHATKDLYGNLVNSRFYRADDYYALMYRVGHGGSSSYGAGRIKEPITYELRDKYNITDYTHTLKNTALSIDEQRQRFDNPKFKLLYEIRRGWLRESEKKTYQALNRYDQDVQRRVEQIAYETAKSHPEARVWSFSTEEETCVPPIMERNFEEFAKVQRAYYRGIKRANPKAIVMPTGGTSGYGKLRGRDIIKGYLKATPDIKWDAVPIHPYGAVDGTQGSGDLDEVIQMLSDDMAECGYGEETPIFLNEGGGGSPYKWGAEPIYSYTGGNPSYDLGLHEFLHACQMARLYLICLKYWPRVPHFNTWQGLDRTLVDNEMALPAPMNAINTLCNMLGNPTFVDDIRPAAGMRGYAFKDERNRGVAALWCTLDDVELGFEKGPIMRVKFDGPLPELIDLMGTSRQLNVDKDGYADIRLTPAPLFLRGGNPTKLADALKNALVIGAGSSLEVSFLPTLSGAINAKVKNLVAREERGRIAVGGKEIPFQAKAYQETLVALPETGDSGFGRMFRWNQAYTVSLDSGFSNSKSWKMDYFYVPHVSGDPDWETVPAIDITNLFRPLRNNKRTPGGHPGDIAASFKLAWNKDNLYLRVEAEDDAFKVDYPKFWESEQAKQTMLYMLDGCLEVYFDCGANGRMSKGGYDLDDYRYDFCVGNPEGKSGPGLVHRLREVYIEYGLGVQMASKEEAAQKINCEFTRLSPTKYAYTIRFAQRYLEPMRLAEGTVAGFGLYLHDRMDDGSLGAKGLSLAAEEGAHCDYNPHLWPLMILGK
jgi:hypothetical protein